MFSYAESIDLIWPPWFIYNASLDIKATLVLLHSFFQSLGNPNSLHRLSRIETLDPVRICFRYCENVEDCLTLILDNSITCELYVMLKVMYQLLVKYTVYRWVSLRSFLAPLQW